MHECEWECKFLWLRCADFTALNEIVIIIPAVVSFWQTLSGTIGPNVHTSGQKKTQFVETSPLGTTGIIATSLDDVDAFTSEGLSFIPIRKWRVSSQNGLYPFWSIWDIWDLSCWNIKKIIKFAILLIITSKIFLYIMRKVSLERYHFVLYDIALTLKISKMALKPFCDKNSSNRLVVHPLSCLWPSSISKMSHAIISLFCIVTPLILKHICAILTSFPKP